MKHLPETEFAGHAPIRARRAPRFRRLALAAAIGVATTALAPATPAHEERLIQPGAAVDLYNRPLGQFGSCTLGFVYRDKRNTYIGTSGSCSANRGPNDEFISGVGNRAVMDDREFGTVVYWVGTGGVNNFATGEWRDDFALIRVDESEVHRVSPVVLDVGQAPHGITTAADAEDGTPVFVTGGGFLLGEQPLTRHRLGALVAHDERGFQLAFAGSAGDGGAPVLYGDFNAYGVLSAFDHSSGMTVERVLVLLEEAGYRVELVTGVDNSVAERSQ